MSALTFALAQQLQASVNLTDAAETLAVFFVPIHHLLGKTAHAQ
jgi:hypothetical protein